MISALENAISADDPDAVQEAIFELGCQPLSGEFIDDEIAIQLLGILRRPEMWRSPVAGHVLMFFEFEANRLSPRAKDRCKAFLREWGGQFTDVYSMHVVGELGIGPYLKEVPVKVPRKKPRHKI
jgi:hypothetical protein